MNEREYLQYKRSKVTTVKQNTIGFNIENFV